MEELTPQEFAAKIKTKYPQYKDVEDSVLVERMLAKYPEYKSKVKFPEAVEPKGATAEVVNGASGSTSAVNKSSLGFKEKNNTPPINEVIARQLNPELYSEMDSLNATIKSRPIMANNSKEEARLSEIKQSIERLAQPKKSVRKIYAEEIDNIDSQIFEIEKKADKLSKSSNFSFEEILQSDGTYQDLKNRRSKNKAYKSEYDQILNRLKEDTNSDQGSFLGKVGRVFGINSGTEQEPDQIIKLNDKVEEQILLDLSSTREKEKILNGYATLSEKEKIISEAKYKVVVNERLDLINEAKAIEQTISDESQKRRKLGEVEEKYNALLGEVGFDTASGILKNNFKKTDESQKFDEMVGADGWFHSTTDAVSTFLEGVVQTGFKGTVGFTADIMSGFGDIFTDQEHYSVYDAFSDTVNQLSNYNYLPSSKSVDTRIVDDSGDFNINYKTVSKSLAQTLPFTLAIVNDVKKGKITNIEASLGRLLNPTKSASVSNSLRLIDSAYRHTLSDNLVMAEELGLDDNQGRIFANTLSMAEGMAELIMPDTKFFKTEVGDLILKNFKGDLKNAASKEAFKQTIKNFTGSIVKELGEEEVILATQDLLKYSMVVGHKNSEFWDLKNQKELAAATVIMSGALGGANVRRDFKGNIIEGYKQIANNINGVTEELQAELESGFHDETVKSEILKSIDWANNLNKAITTAPVNVTGEQVDLLMEKAALVSEMKSVDDAFHPQYKEKIEAINIKINSANGKTGETKTETTGTKSRENVGATEDVVSTKTTNAEQGDVQTKGEKGYNKVRHLSTFLSKEVSKYESKDISEYKDYFDNLRVYELAKEAGVKVVLLTDEIRKNPLLDVEGGKYVGEGYILVNPKYINSLYKGSNVIQHEASHAYTAKVLMNRNLSELTVEEKEFRHGIEEVYKSKKTFLNTEYGFKNTYELVAEFLSNSSFRDKIKGVDLSFYDKVKHLIAKFINKQTKIKIEDVISNFESYLLPINNKKELSDAQSEVTNDAVTPEQKTVYQNTAKAIRSAKIYKTPSDALNKLSSNPAGLLAVAWDGALETVATTVELTGNLDAAIRKGVTQIKQSEWYKSLSPEGKKEALGIMENDLRVNLTPLSESFVSKSKQPVKNTIRKTTGQVDQSKKFTISEANLLKDKFKNLARGSAIGAKSVMEDKKGFIKDISTQLKSLVNSKVMSTTEATRVLSAVNQFNGKNIDKVQPLVDKVVDAIEKRGLSKNIKAQKFKLRKAAKSERNPVNVRGLAKAATKVNEKYLDSSSQKEYDDLLSEIGNAVATPTSKKYNMAVEEEMYSRLNNLNEKAEKARIEELAATMGLEGQGLTESELNAIWESDNVDEYIDTLKEEKAKVARLSLEKQAEYAIIALNDVDVTQLSEQERKDVRELKNADLTLLSSTDIRDLIKIVDNIVLNEDFSSSGEIVSKVRSYNASKEAISHFSKDEVNMIRKSVITDLKSVALIFKKVFMSAKRSATFNRLSGLSKLSMSYTSHKKAMDKLAVDYNDLFRNIKKKNSGITKPENTIFRGLVGQLIQGTTTEDFSINKSRVEDHLTQIKKNQSQGLREGAEKLQQEYDKIKDLKSQDEVIEYAKNLNDGNWDIIDFWLKHFESTKDALKYNTEVVHGKSFEEVSGNYLPIKMKGDIQHSVDVDNEAFFNVNGLPASNPSTTTISRTKTKKLPKDRILDLDFDSVMFNKANAVSIDIETSADYKDVYNFFRSPNMEEMFGRETLDVFNKKVKEMRRVQLGISSMDVSQDEITKNITKVERMWKSVGTSIALGGITQYPKQYFSVVTNIIPNLGKHGGLMFKAMFMDKSNMPILDMVSISMRGETQGGTVTASTRISEAEKKATKAMVGRIVQETGLVAEKVRNALFFSLRKGDVNVAKSSWVAFYQSSLLDQGVDSKDIDMTVEHEKLDDVRRQQAISYAELKVEETQIASDDSRGSEFYQSKEAYKAILRSLLLPFQSFNINSKMRMLNDLNIIGSQRSNTEQKLEAARSLLGTASEIVTFQTMKYYILAPLIGLGKDAIMELFDLDSPDEDEEQQKEFKFKQWYSALTKDLNPLTIGAFAEDMNIEVLNYLQYLQEGESDEEYIDFIKRTRDDGGQLFYRYKDKEERNKGFGASLLNGGGLYAIPMTQFGEASETFDLMMKGTKRDDYGNLNEYDFSDEEKAFLRVAFAIELTSLFGLGEADTRRIFTSIRRDLLRNTDKQKIN